MSFQQDGFQHDGFQTGLFGAGAASVPIIPNLFGMPSRAPAADAGEIVSARYRTQEAPFSPKLFGMPPPVWKAVPALIAANLLLSAVVATPPPVQAKQFDVPKAISERIQFNPPNLLTGILPPQELAKARTFDVPRPSFPLVSSAFPNLLETTLGQPPVLQLPFRAPEFTAPPFVQARAGFNPPNLLATTLAAVVEQPFRTPQFSAPPFVQVRVQFNPPNLLETTLAGPVTQPFAKYDWSTPYRTLALPDFRPPNLLEGTLGLPAGEKPFGRQEFPLPPFKAVERIQLGWQWTIPPDLLPPAITLPSGATPGWPIPGKKLRHRDYKAQEHAERIALGILPPDKEAQAVEIVKAAGTSGQKRAVAGASGQKAIVQQQPDYEALFLALYLSAHPQLVASEIQEAFRLAVQAELAAQEEFAFILMLSDL